MGHMWLRVRAVLDDWFAVAVLALLIVSVAGGWLTYTGHVDPGMTTERETVSAWETNGTFTHAAVVSAENPVYDVGTELRGESLYLDSIAPVVDGSFVFRYAATESGTIDVSVDQHLRKRKVVERGTGTVTVWETMEPLGNRSVGGVEPDSPVRVPFTVNVTEERNESGQIDDRLDNPPGELRVAVVATATLSGTVNGRSVEQTVTYEMPVEFDGGTYSLNGTAATDRHERTRVVESPRDPSPVQRAGGPAVLGLALLGLGGLLASRTRNELSLTETERARLAFESDRESFGEWIHTFDLPAVAEERPRVEAATLGDLVDFAIDTDNSVLADPDGERYVVLHDGHCYVYEPPTTGGAPGERATSGGDGIAGRLRSLAGRSESSAREPIEEDGE
ncbi:DUF5305 domain-containing protein [Haloarcula salina]|uniref:DUF5305 domain-containing protein n=1 Tax=Haloarcula salina TaxID=1429914 RepID=A0AA41FYF2_9EURY|nr:DUF5305 domain-containing protein [Haloarcula salina]MBV0900913.1 hypothetical protein [Haloarcula salina]